MPKLGTLNPIRVQGLGFRAYGSLISDEHRKPPEALKILETSVNPQPENLNPKPAQALKV